MTRSEGIHKDSKYVVVKFSDFIDYMLMLLESNVELTLLEFGMDLLPCAIEETDIVEYFNSFQFHSSEQVVDLHEKTEIIVDLVKRNNVI